MEAQAHVVVKILRIKNTKIEQTIIKAGGLRQYSHADVGDVGDKDTAGGNLKDMMFNLTEIGSDLEFRGAIASPTIRIDGLTVAGE